MVECVKALALCHNVTPVVEEGEREGEGEGEEMVDVEEEKEVVIFQKGYTVQSNRSYQASSPDEV